MRTVLRLTVLALALTSRAASAQPEELLLFDFEEADDLKAWTNLKLPGSKGKEPAARLERSTDMASSGKYSLKIAFGGEAWPTLTTTSVAAD